jgi:UDP-N-acetylmuramate--alanine ligase
MKRAQVLGLISESSDTIAVAGTHGKTTTSSLIAHIMKHIGHGCNAFLGGISANYQTNLLLDPASRQVVVEADEFDRSFLTLSPALSVITSMDADHLDIYGTHDYMRASYQLFAERTRSGGTLLHRAGLPLRFEAPTPYAVRTYSITEPAAYTGSQIRVENGQYHFDLMAQQEHGGALRLIENAVLGLAGRHNVENAVAACGICHLLGIDVARIKEALATYTGVRRRFEYVFWSADRVLIDDYAHHPEELRAAISSARELFPDWQVTGVFQPHLFTRTRDFADAFARSLELLDRVILLPVYPARELPLPGIDSQMLLDKINIPSKKMVEKGELLAELAEVPQGVLMMLGAGDIDTLVQPVKNLYLR